MQYWKVTERLGDLLYYEVVKHNENERIKYLHNCNTVIYITVLQFSFHIAGCTYFFLRKKDESLKVVIYTGIVLVTSARI